MDLVVASHNLHKIREYRAMLKQFPQFDVLTLIDFPDYVALEETGATFEDNAFTKGAHAAKALNNWVLADDSGLVIPALNNQPGIFSSRFAGDDATDKDNRKKLIAELSQISEEERTGYYYCSLVLAAPDGVKKSTHGICEGSIILKERGRNGFGYDPIFVKYDYSKTFAELDEETKNRISHRRKAFEKIIPSLELLLSGDSACIT